MLCLISRRTIKTFKKQVSDDKKGEIESTLDDNPGFIELLKIAAIIGAVKLASHKDKKKSLRNLGHDIVWVARDKIYGTCDSIKSTVDKLLLQQIAGMESFRKSCLLFFIRFSVGYQIFPRRYYP